MNLPPILGFHPVALAGRRPLRKTHSATQRFLASRSPLVVRCALTFLAAVLTFGCSDNAEKTPDVIVLQTGRLSGNVYPQSLQNIAALQHYPYLAGAVKKIRAEAKEIGAEVVLVDVGDSLGGSFASHVTGSGNMIEFFNEVGYDAIVLGNLDNNISPGVIARLDAAVLNPFAAPNGQPATEGTTFAIRLERGAIPIDILANFYGEVSREEFPERFPTWFGTTDDDVTPVRDYGGVIESLGEELPGALTLLTWMKFESPKNPPRAFLKTLADLGVDAILAHRIYTSGKRDVWSEQTLYDWVPPVSENILRNNGGFTLARLDLKRDGVGWRVLHQELLPMTANTAAADPAIMKKIAGFAEIIAQADRTLDELPEAISQDQILRVCLSALSEIPGTQVAVYSRQSVRGDWPAGPLTASRVFNSLPWSNPIVQMTLKPSQLGQLGGLSGLVFLRRDDAPPDADLTVTTSRFFASLIADQLNLPASAVRNTDATSEFDTFVDYLTTAPKPLDFNLPPGWTLEDPRG